MAGGGNMVEKKAPKKPNVKTKKKNHKISEGIIVGLIGLAGTIIGAILTITLPPLINPPQQPTPILVTPTPIPVSTIDATGIVMRLVPEGIFIMGSNDGNSNAQPSHEVYLKSFFIDENEVTNEQYKQCVNAKICQPPNEKKSPLRTNYYGDSQYDDYPVVWIDWNKAYTYCTKWRKGNLPSEAQWEKAARSPDSRSFPWGEEISCRNANYAGCVGDTLVVGLFENGKSIYGAYDMVGNVSEWVADWYSGDFYSSPEANYEPSGPEAGRLRVVRGGSWYVQYNGIKLYERTAHLPTFADKDLGFRCVLEYAP